MRSPLTQSYARKTHSSFIAATQFTIVINRHMTELVLLPNTYHVSIILNDKE